jgi:virginiamycin B lyase
MRVRPIVVALLAGVSILVLQVRPLPVHAATDGAPALTGRVSSAEEGAMEGVLVSAKKSGSTIAVTVVTDEQGRYAFPANRLGPGQYGLSIRAVGYDLDGPSAVTITAQKPAAADLKLKKAADLAWQLTNTEWLNSMPGTPQQKASIYGCTHCHTLRLVTQSHHDEAGWLPVLERMASYPPLAFPPMPQKLKARRIGGGEDTPDRRLPGQKRQAAYLATINLSATPTWKYELKTLPRPKGTATKVIYTEYDLPARTRQPHDVIVDRQGAVWYNAFGEQIVGKMDPKTGTVKEYTIPTLKPGANTGTLGMRFDNDENLWFGMQFQGGIAKFDKTTEKFQTWSLPADLNGDHVQINQVSPNSSYLDGKVWLQDAGTYTLLRLDLATSNMETFAPLPIPRPNIYDILADSQNNGWFTVMGAEHIGRIDAKTGKMTVIPTPTKNSGPRRGMIDEHDRLWFGENRADRIGMYDTRAGTFQEWVTPTALSMPYDVTADKNGEAWAGGEYNDLVQRLNPKTGAIIEYLLPKPTNVRRVFVDNSTTPVTFWVGSNHGASIVKLEPIE